MKYFILCYLILLVSIQAEASFYENSRRRPTTDIERKYLANIGGCAGFFVQNTQGKNLLVTARHCLNYSASQFCKDKKIIFDRKHELERQCLRIVASSAKLDITMIEVDGPLRDQEDNLILADFTPQAQTRIYLVGFPNDQYAFSGANVTENCWILSNDISYPYQGTIYWKKGLQDPALWHNCSTFGGNSGGPVIIEGSNVVVGLPFTYDQTNIGNKNPYSSQARFNLMSNYVELLRNDLEDAGVILTQEGNNEGVQQNYLRSGHYKSDSVEDCIIILDVVYLTSEKIQRIDATYEGKNCSGKESYKCNDDTCKANSGSIIQISENSFYYTSVKGTAAHFSNY
jgi:hypothetical protein